MKFSPRTLALGAAAAALLSGPALSAEITIATVNNSDMVVMQELSKKYEEMHPDTKINWVILEENVLRQRLTTDISTGGGQFDVLTIGLFEAPMWGENGWLVPFENVPDSYELDDVLKTVRDGLSFDGKLYALPFYGESQMTIYRTDLLEKAGVEMPEQPTWDDIGRIAAAIHDPDNGVYGLCLRGKPGWGENVGQITPMANSYGARWFDMDWKAQLDSPAWNEALTKYVTLLKDYGPPGVASNGYNETLALYANGSCGIWVDATVSAGFLSDPNQSKVVGKVGYALPPVGKYPKGNHYLWAWSLAVPSSSRSVEAAQDFIYWATSKDYIKLVADRSGWATVPPGTRVSTYENQAYLDAAPFAKVTLETMMSADPTDATQEEVPYVGIGYVGIPEFQSIGTTVGQEFAAAIAGTKTVEEALKAAQESTVRAMSQAGYTE